jgi:hypothetical protein
MTTIRGGGGGGGGGGGLVRLIGLRPTTDDVSNAEDEVCLCVRASEERQEEEAEEEEEYVDVYIRLDER